MKLARAIDGPEHRYPEYDTYSGANSPLQRINENAELTLQTRCDL